MLTVNIELTVLRRANRKQPFTVADVILLFMTLNITLIIPKHGLRKIKLDLCQRCH